MRLRIARLIACAVCIGLPCSGLAQDAPVESNGICEGTDAASTTEALLFALSGPSLGTVELDFLTRAKASPMVEAYLLARVSRSGTPDHPLTRRVQAFLDTPVQDLRGLTEARLPVGDLIEALREAEERRLRRDERVRTDSDALQAAVEEVVALATRRGGSTTPSVRNALLAALEDFGAAPRLEGVPSSAMEEACDAWEAFVEAESRRKAAELEARERVSAVERSEVEVAQAVERVALAEADVASIQTAVADSLNDPGVELSDQTPEIQAVVDAAQAALQAQSAAERGLASARAELAELRGEQMQAAGLSDPLGELAAAFLALQEALPPPPPPPPPTTGISSDKGPPVTLGARDNGLPALEASPEAARSPNVLVALTDFVIERAKQELVYDFVADVYRWGNASTSTDTKRQARDDARRALVRASFRETFGLMDAAATDGSLTIRSAAAVPLSMWRYTVVRDLQEMPLRLAQSDALCEGLSAGDSEDAEALPSAKAACRSQKRAVGVVLEAGRRALGGASMLEVVGSLPAIADTLGVRADARWRSLASGLHLAGLLARGYLSQGSPDAQARDRYGFFLNAEDLRAEWSERSTLTGSLVRVAVVEAAGALGLGATMEGSESDVMGRLTALAESVEGLRSSVEMAEGGQAKTSAAVRGLLSVLRASLNAGALFEDDPSRLQAAAARLRDGELVVDAYASGDYGIAAARTLGLASQLRGNRPLPREVTALTGLAVGLAEARTSRDMELAFEAAAAPVGGWQAKRYRDGSRVSLTAYPGMGVGREWTETAPDTLSRGWTLGLSLPVGVEIALGKRSTLEPNRGPVGSWGLMVTPIDLGPLLSWRVGGSDVASTPNATFRQALSPGVALAYGWGEAPVSLVLGAQYVPELRAPVDAPEGAGGLNTWRVTFGVAVDVVLFEF